MMIVPQIWVPLAAAGIAAVTALYVARRHRTLLRKQDMSKQIQQDMQELYNPLLERLEKLKSVLDDASPQRIRSKALALTGWVEKLRIKGRDRRLVPPVHGLVIEFVDFIRRSETAPEVLAHAVADGPGLDGKVYVVSGEKAERFFREGPDRQPTISNPYTVRMNDIVEAPFSSHAFAVGSRLRIDAISSTVGKLLHPGSPD